MVSNNGGYGIYLCGNATTPTACVAPGVEAIASSNEVRENIFESNALGDVEDKGTGKDLTAEEEVEQSTKAPDSGAAQKGGWLRIVSVVATTISNAFV